MKTAAEQVKSLVSALSEWERGEYVAVMSPSTYASAENRAALHEPGLAILLDHRMPPDVVYAMTLDALGRLGDE